MRICFLYMNSDRNVGRGAGYVAASISKKHSVAFIDTRRVASVNLPKEVLKHEADILMVSSMTLMWNSAIKAIQEVKRVTPKLPVLVGGTHPTIMREKILQDYLCIDYVCVGEGESFIKEFLANYGTDALLNVANLIYRKGDKIYSNQPSLVLDYHSKIPESRWPNYFAKLMEYALAKEFAIQIREDTGMAQLMNQLYVGQGQKSRAVESKQRIQRPIQSQPFIQARY